MTAAPSAPPPPVTVVDFAPGGDAVRLLDQTRLPAAEVHVEVGTRDEFVEAIRSLRVRGAPAIGVAGALGLAVLARRAAAGGGDFDAQLAADAQALRSARPTAVNLAWAVDRTLAAGAARSADDGPVARAARMHDEAARIRDEDRAMCAAIGRHGAALLRDGMRVLTHCNAGALATAGIGTALAPIYVAHAAGCALHVWADETRPLLQGARLTAWELARAGVPVTVCTDGMAAALMRAGRVDLVIVGADRIAANGDVANKIGTYGVAVAARHHGIPFVVAAPRSTIDPATPDGDAIEIEQRPADEVRALHGAPIAPAGAAVHNPAFDVTPAALVTAIVTDVGVHHPPFDFRTLPA
ncbi:MAG: S-methyl-5-thioribose-1-phosphate isomerase [Gemmatimonadaceae bacterium]|jgi:methylthioribose-1-phosphate isomerase|nr:S-methyl-5-thioribose-1-phosphate isomerase [Gemmatimonadaceae bacterium]